MTKPQKTFSACFIASIIFFIISLIGIFPMIEASNHPKDGFAGAGQGWATLYMIVFISLPATIISLTCGIIALAKTPFAWLTITPTAMFILYVLSLFM